MIEAAVAPVWVRPNSAKSATTAGQYLYDTFTWESSMQAPVLTKAMKMPFPKRGPMLICSTVISSVLATVSTRVHCVVSWVEGAILGRSREVDWFTRMENFSRQNDPDIFAQDLKIVIATKTLRCACQASLRKAALQVIVLPKSAKIRAAAESSSGAIRLKLAQRPPWICTHKQAWACSWLTSERLFPQLARNYQPLRITAVLLLAAL